MLRFTIKNCLRHFNMHACIIQQTVLFMCNSIIIIQAEPGLRSFAVGNYSSMNS